jgi:hypothetical protein
MTHDRAARIIIQSKNDEEKAGTTLQEKKP